MKVHNSAIIIKEVNHTKLLILQIYGTEIIENNNCMTNLILYSTQIGPVLAKNIYISTCCLNVSSFLHNNNNATLYLKPTDDEEVKKQLSYVAIDSIAMHYQMLLLRQI